MKLNIHNCNKIENYRFILENITEGKQNTKKGIDSIEMGTLEI